jgi:hypothetical protein
MNNLHTSKYIFNARQTFRSIRNPTKKYSDLGKFFLAGDLRDQCQHGKPAFSNGSLTSPDTDTSLGRKDHPRTSLIGDQPIDPLTSERPEHRSSFVLAAGKRDDRLFRRTA